MAVRSSGTDTALVKKPHSKTRYTLEAIAQLSACMDTEDGPLFFMSNFMYIQHPVKGKMLFAPFDFQRELLKSYNDHRFSINMCGRQLGKTTVAAGYLLWYAMFIPDSTILIAAHKGSGSLEIMQRIRFAYECMPDHIRCGTVSYNRGSVEFDNGSRIISQATTENTGRGLSISLLYCDEFAFVRPSIAKEFWTSISPTLATGGKAIITSTPNNDDDQFAILWNGANKKFDEHGNETNVGQNGFHPFKALWHQHPDRDEQWANEERLRVGEERFRREHLCIAGSTKLRLRAPDGSELLLTIEELSTVLDQYDETI